ncbi:hypothetical protein F5884DRAFT_790612 [Xylogone sp. PMI_703]|nr:hypothetical protein F5884DRAFT_790612 [Xylogone sp. PMI_703]
MFQERDDLFKDRNALMLTRGHVYGTELIYDLDRRTITAWKHFSQSDYWTDEPAYSMTSVHNPLYVWINDFLTFKYIPFESNIIFPLPTDPYSCPWDNAREEEVEWWRKDIERQEKERGLMNVYTECGWKTGTAEYLGISEDDGKDMVNDEQDRMWEKLEQARQMARRDFQGDLFEEEREEYMGSIYAETS